MKKTVAVFFGVLFTAIILLPGCNYFGPKIMVENKMIENELKPKFHYYDKDNLLVFIPYKFSIKNNSSRKLKLKSITCPVKWNGTIYSQLVYSENGHETMMDGDFGDYATENIINPFEEKSFYFYLPNTAAKKNFLNAEFVEDLYKKLPYEVVEKHINNLKESVNITAKNDFIASLYQTNKDNIVEIILTDNTDINKTVKRKIFPYEENYIIKIKL